MRQIAAEDFIAIYNLMGRYGHIMDEWSAAGGPWDRLGEIFTPEAVFEVEPYGVRLNSLRELQDAWGASVHPWGHHVTNLVVDPDGPDGARCDSKIVIVLADARTMTGVYRDRLTRTAAGWRITHRHCVMRLIDPDAPKPVM